MHIRTTKYLVVLCILLTFVIAGCGQLHGQAPVVNISDPAVYTSLHLYAAKKHIQQHMNSQKEPNEPNVSFSVMDDMARYFRRNEGWYKKNHLRMDAMLDDSQRISDALHVYESMTRLGLRYSPLGLQAAAEPLATGLIPSSLFSGSPETLEKLKKAEQAQKVVKEKEAELKKAEAALAKAKESHAIAGASVKTAAEVLVNKKVHLKEVQHEKKQAEVDLLIAKAKTEQLDSKAQVAEENATKKPSDAHLQEEARKLRNKANEAKDEANKISISILEISKALVDAEHEVEKAKDQLEKERSKEAEGEVKAAEKKVNEAKKPLSGAKAKVEQTQKEARDALSKEVEHPLAALRPKLVGLVSDSPFDRIDRARDFYTAYMLKILRSLDGSRVIDPNPMVKDCDLRARAHGMVLDPCKRLLLIAFQVHVNPGTRPNYMVGLRLTVKRVEPSSCEPNSVKIIQLHPTRAYDIEDQLLLERINTAFGLSLSGSITGTKDEMKFLWEERRTSELRRNYLSRISKIASFADAGRNEFGWNFYPSNLTVERKGPVQSFNEWFKSGPSDDYVVNAYLEGGARDCSVYMLVPHNLKKIDLSVEYLVKSVAHGELNRPERRYHIDKHGMRRKIYWLKKPSFIENVIRPLSFLFTSPHDHKRIEETKYKNEYVYVTVQLPD